ncbi:hypothetical protein LCGC14_1491210 [marine sediment metagenome]|uniref:Uncharacterized protein n=1 Tax=marine sediment metagenome TaxID=412755 RepID=A0A0F9J6P8_9ZZZZ
MTDQEKNEVDTIDSAGYYGPMGDWIPEGACPCDRCVATRSLSRLTVRKATCMERLCPRPGATCADMVCPDRVNPEGSSA